MLPEERRDQIDYAVGRYRELLNQIEKTIDPVDWTDRLVDAAQDLAWALTACCKPLYVVTEIEDGQVSDLWAYETKEEALNAWHNMQREPYGYVQAFEWSPTGLVSIDPHPEKAAA